MHQKDLKLSLIHARQFSINKTAYHLPVNQLVQCGKQHPVKNEFCLLSHMISPHFIYKTSFHHGNSIYCPLYQLTFHLYFDFHFTRLRFSALFDVFQPISLLVIIVFIKVYARSMFLYEVGPSISSSVVLGSFDLSVYIKALDISRITENKEEKLRVRRHRQLHNDLKRMGKIWGFSFN